MRYATITATGAHVPARVVTNAELSARLGEDIDEFVSTVLGIRERHVCGEGDSTASLATEAGKRALAAAGLAPEDLDLLIVATDTPEYISPATSSVVHGRLGLTRAAAFDVNAACAGFVTALDIAGKYVAADERYRHVLITAVYAMTRFVDPLDKKTVTIFADGAGAVVVQAAQAPGLLGSELLADGRYAQHMGIFAGGAARPVTEEIARAGIENRLRFVEKYPKEVNEEGWPRLVRSLLSRLGRSPDDVALWLWTQVNLSTIRAVMERLRQPMEKTHTIMGKWGYTGSACLPMALDDARAAGRLRPGDLVVLTGSGAGLAMGSVALIWNPVGE